MVVNFRTEYEKFGQKISRLDNITDRSRKNLTVKLASGANGLEIGCAEGYMTAELSKKFSFFVASDISINYLKRAKSLVNNVSFIAFDCHHLPFKNNSFDNIVLTEVLEHTLSPFRVLEEIRRVLTDNGQLILSVPNNMSLHNIYRHLFKKYSSFITDKSAHIAFFDYGSLLKLLSMVGFKATGVYTPYFSIPRIDKLLNWIKIRKVLGKKLPQFGNQIMVTAEKCHSNFALSEIR